ncbi:restriction endonuclease [Lachnospiraceae bacterium LCP25S3_G4]
MLSFIRGYYKDFPQAFENCATDIVAKMDTNFVHFSITRPWRDGGRDAVGHYIISTGGKANYPLKIDCALEAKCYNENHAVGVREMSRLISRIRYRQFGILITTSCVDNQAYNEVVEDGHPILIVTASDIAEY